MKRIMMAMLLAACITMVVPTSAEAATKYKVTATAGKTIKVGKTTTLAVKKNGKKVKSVKWVSKNTKIATVSKKSGKVVAKSVGKTVVSAKKSGKTIAKVTVKVAPTSVKCDKVTLSTSKTVGLGNLYASTKKTVKVAGTGAKITSVKSSNASVAKVTLAGNKKSFSIASGTKKTGKATITVKVNGVFTYKCTVTNQYASNVTVVEEDDDEDFSSNDSADTSSEVGDTVSQCQTTGGYEIHTWSKYEITKEPVVQEGQTATYRLQDAGRAVAKCKYCGKEDVCYVYKYYTDIEDPLVQGKEWKYIYFGFTEDNDLSYVNKLRADASKWEKFGLTPYTNLPYQQIPAEEHEWLLNTWVALCINTLDTNYPWSWTRCYGGGAGGYGAGIGSEAWDGCYGNAENDLGCQLSVLLSPGTDIDRGTEFYGTTIIVGISDTSCTPQSGRAYASTFTYSNASITAAKTHELYPLYAVN